MKKVLLLLAQGFETYEAGAFIDVIGWNMVDGDKSTSLYTCGFKRVVNSSFNQKFAVDYLIDEVNADEFDALAIPGGFEEYSFYEEAYHEAFLNLIRNFNAGQKTIASMCVGALPLGKSGILRGRDATTYNKNPVRLEALRSFGANVLSQPVVTDKNIITCWNPSTAMDAAFLLLERLTSESNASYIRRIMGFENNSKI